MKFKVGDKVILKECDDSTFVNSMEVYIGQEDVITFHHVGYNGENYYNARGNFWNWHESSLELVESKSETQEYFYVGQTVYSPLFQNKERKAVIKRIDNSINHPILCEGENVSLTFRLDGKYIESQDFVSLFQEPIQFPVNKPIERFEEGEIVEVSSNDEYWRLARFVSYNNHDVLRYKVTITTGIDREVKETFNYSSIRKVK